MNYIYFNHKGLEICNDENLQILLQEMSEKINICRSNGLTLGFYKNIHDIPLKNLNNTFINHVCSNKKYMDFCNLMIKYIDENIRYPQNDSSNLYIENSDFQQWFLNICLQDNVSFFISLSNDTILGNSFYIEKEKKIRNFIEKNDLINFIKSFQNNFKSFIDVFDKIKSKYPNKIEILRNAEISTRQIANSNKTFNDIYCALSNLVEIILPTNSNTLTESICEKYYAATSFKISRESSTTTSHPKYKKYRTFNINGTQYEFQNHAKIGNNIRIHYYILNNKIYIGHCGKHLPTSSFN